MVVPGVVRETEVMPCCLPDLVSRKSDPHLIGCNVLNSVHLLSTYGMPYQSWLLAACRICGSMELPLEWRSLVHANQVLITDTSLTSRGLAFP